MNAEAERLFFALWPPPEVRAELAHQVAGVVAEIKGKPVATDRLHVTLAFLGETQLAQRACVEQVAAGLRGDPFELVLDRIGYFPRPRVVWLGCQEPPQSLGELAAALNDGLGACGCRTDTRPFRVHITLMRKVRRKPALATITPVHWRVDSFVLVRSELRPDGAHYAILRRWDL